MVANLLQSLWQDDALNIAIIECPVADLLDGVREVHGFQLAKAVAARGAQLYNIIPLIPQNELNWCTRPDCALIDRTRQRCERYVRVFRHCQHCRADAAGIPGGTDVSRQLYIRPVTLENTFSHG